ncbi:1f99ae8a-4da0-4fc0-93be-a6c3ebe73771 [Thermothielavioides terrestris]|nr:1f99ae8a-4da0-4fc0-93be-a6c3ebe73771 [Thermothielavioides terrestris]
MPATDLRLLALDGGGVRGLSSLMILRRLMESVDPDADAPPKPCDYFDMIGGTSTGGLIAIMLGRLRMTVDECIDAYTTLSDRIFKKKNHRVTITGKLQGRFDGAELERAVKAILVNRGLGEDALLKDPDSPCKVFVCATSKETGQTVCLANYRSPRRDNSDLLNATTIWQACRATSAATTFFDPIAIGPFNQEFVDGAFGANNPVYELWNQAKDLWGDQLRGNLRCLVSIGTGLAALQPVRDDVLGISATLKAITTETEKTAEQFRRDKSDLDDEGRYYRFNVDRGLEEIGLEESTKKKEIAAATQRYLESQAVFKQMKACANNIAGREYHGPYRTSFSLQGVPASSHFVARPSDTEELEKHLLPPRRSRTTQRRIFVLYGLGGIGKTQLAADFARRHQAAFSSVFWLDGRSEDRLRQSLASCARRIPEGQIPERSRTAVLHSGEDLKTVVNDVLDWLARPDNSDWLLIFDNVDYGVDQGSETGAYDVRRYLPGDHGSVLITTRLARLAQLGGSMQLRAADEQLAKAIFQQWRGADGAMDEAGRELLALLDGLPLALAQAASYIRETGLETASYVRLYKQQWSDLMGSDGGSGSPLLDYEHGSVATTWTVSFKAVEAQNMNAANLLRLWAFLDGRDLWHGLLQPVADGGEQWPGWLCDIAGNEVRYLDAVRLLLRYSMIDSQESVPGSHMMHPVVHRWASHMQDSAGKRVFLRLAVMVVGSSVPSSTKKDYWVGQRRLLPHAERCSYWIGEICGMGRSFEDAAAIHAMRMLGLLYSDQVRLTEAESMYQRALEGSEKVLGPNHTSTLDLVNALGNLYVNQGRLAEAEPMYQRALEGREKALGRDDVFTLSTVNDFGILYRKQGRLTEAELMHQRALEGREKALGRDHALTLSTVNDLGILYKKQGRLREAESMFKRALDGYEKALGRDH